MKSHLAHQRGNDLDEFLSLDISSVQIGDERPRPPKIAIGVKTTKWNGIWLDIPYAEFGHSDVHVFVKVGVSKDHLMAFLKSLSVMRDKILPKGVQVGSLTEAESNELYDELPSFKPIPAYICGYANKIDNHHTHHDGILKKKNYTVTSWKGPFTTQLLEKIKVDERVPGKVLLAGINELSHDKGYLFNAGNLSWKREDWEEVISRI